MVLSPEAVREIENTQHLLERVHPALREHLQAQLVAQLRGASAKLGDAYSAQNWLKAIEADAEVRSILGKLKAEA